MKITKLFQDLGFKQTNGDPCILVLQDRPGFAIEWIYVDDTLLASNSIQLLKRVKSGIKARLQTKNLGEAKKIIG